MREVEVSLSDLRQRLGGYVNRAAYGGERIVLLSYGEPKAAIIGVEDLELLRQAGAQRDGAAHAFAAAGLLRERIRRWQQEQGIQSGDVVETLRAVRETQ